MDDRTRAPGTQAEHHASAAERPRAVTVAGLLLLLLPVVGAITLVSGVVAVSAAQDNAGRLVEQLAGQGFPGAQALVDDLVSAMWIQVGVATVVRLGQAVGLGVLAFFVLRGSARARTAVYVIAGLSVVAAVGLAVLTGVARGLRGSLDRLADTAGITIVDQTDVLPAWYQPVNYAALAVAIGMILGAVWLLTRPAANAYFRRSLPPAPQRQVPGQVHIATTGGSTPAGTASHPPAPVAAPRPVGVRRGLSPRSVFLLVLGVVLAAGLWTVAVIRDIRARPVVPPIAVSTPDPQPRKVIYYVQAAGMKSDVDIRYSDGSGDPASDTLSAGVPLFAYPVDIPDSRYMVVSLTASARLPAEPPDLYLPPRLRCSISVDGVVVARQENLGSCFALYALDKFTGTPLPTVS